MEKRIDIQHENINIETDYDQQLVNHDFCVNNEADDNNQCILAELTDFGSNIDKSKHNDSNLWIVNIESKSTIEFNTTINIENKAHIVHPIENFNNHLLTVSGQIHNCEKEYQCEICNENFHEKYNLDFHKSIHANIETFKYTTCGEQFLELDGLKSHSISCIDNNIKLLENQFFQECNDGGECNSNLCNNITMLDGLKTSHSEGGVSTQNKTTTLEFSEKIENILPTKPCSNDSKKCADSCLTAGNAVNSRALANHEHVSLDESNNVSSVGQNEYNNDEVYKCNKCGKEFGSLNSLNKHQDLHPGYKPYKCNECGKLFSKNRSLTQHLKRHFGFNPYQCSLCDESYSTYFDFKCHKRVHKGEKPFKCDICGDLFTQLADWNIHKKTHYENKNFECNECHKKFANKTIIKNHLQTHFEKFKRHKCRVCYKNFAEHEYLIRHEKKHKSCNQYVCNVCKKSFNNRLNYTDHLNIHTGDKPYLCELCGRTYPVLKSLNRHKKINHMCDICNKFYIVPKELVVHSATHEKSNVCKLCDKAFRVRSELYQHQLTHSCKKPFECDICPKSYVRSTALANHRRKHTGERPYKCKLCNKTYPHFSSLNRHEATAHK